MKTRSRRPHVRLADPTASPAGRDLYRSLLRAAALAFVIVLPLFISIRGHESYRMPKQLLLHAGAIVLAAIAAAAVVSGQIPIGRLAPPRRVAIVAATLLVWIAISTTISVAPLLSASAALTVISALVVFIVFVVVACETPLWMAGTLLVPAVMNAILVTLQELHVWNPLAVPEVQNLHESTTGLLGNPNDVGMFMTPAFVTAIALAGTARKKMIPGAAAVLIACAILASQSRGAIAAALAGGIAVVWVGSRRRALAVTLLLMVLTFTAITSYPRLLNRMLGSDSSSLLAYTSGRIVPFAVATRMVLGRPLVGVGVGCFEYAYFDGRLRLQRTSSRWPATPRQLMFGEVHNDHLQVAAEMGLPGLALLWGAILLLASYSRKSAGRPDETPERRFSRLAALPLSVSFIVLAFAQFPLQLAASQVAYCFAAALVVGWSDDTRT